MAANPTDYHPEWLYVEQMMGGRQAMPAEPVDQSRARFEAFGANLIPMMPPPSEKVSVQDITITGNIRVRVYKPNGDEKSPLPVGLYIHSGGWYTGSIEAEDHLCRNIVENVDIILFSPEYRLAPEHPYPAGLDDLSAVYEFMHSDGSKFGGDGNNKIIMGGSAGGNLAVCVALKYVSRSTMKPTGLVAACMMSCEPSALPQSYAGRYQPEMYSDSAILSMDLVNKVREWYKAPAAEPLHSPLLHPDIGLLPKTYITACTKDPTHQETLFFYEECKKQGVLVDYKEWVGWPHFFWIIPVIPSSTAFMNEWNSQLAHMIEHAKATASVPA